MVKGITKQVILVKSPDPKLFEEAIFIVKEEALAKEGLDAEQVIRQARQAADCYLKGNRNWKRTLQKMPLLTGFYGAQQVGYWHQESGWFLCFYLER